MAKEIKKAAGYSGTPLARKLGIKEGSVISILHEPPGYRELFSDFPEAVEVRRDGRIKKDFIHYFVKERARLEKDISLLKDQLVQNGVIWISWPKKSSGVVTDITEDVIRAIAIKKGLVDIKVCAVDEIWSGLKLVVPVKNRISG